LAAFLALEVPMPKLNHVALTVKDREVSATFYAKFFGLAERVHDDDHLLILSSPAGGLLALSEGTVPSPPPRTTHFGFEGTSVSAVRELRKRFQAAKVQEAEWQASGPTRVQVFDPDGYRVEIYAWD
jgi:catechol 2,3-dioxygenase-like lactoylglutathione lyase family enzyme